VTIGLIVLGLTLLMTAWVMATQPFAAPDEASHYLRALSIANERLVGPKVPYVPVPAGLTPTQLSWADDGSRAVWVPARLSPPDVVCMIGRPDIGLPGCVEATETGDYQPLAYLLPAVALTVSHDATTGLWLSRMASAIPCLVFILLAVVMLFDGSVWSLLGLWGAMSPMVLFVCSIVNPNGLELASCLAFAASVLRITRAPADAPVLAWWVFALSGATAILAWQLGPVFVLGDLTLGGALLGREGLRQLRQSQRRHHRFSTLALVTAAILYLVYGVASGASHAQFGISPIRLSLHEGLLQLAPVLRDSVGTFGALTIPLPATAYRIWWLFDIAIVAGAMWVGGGRRLRLLAVVVVLCLASPVLFYAWAYRFTGFGLQGRYLLPVMVLIPLLAGEIINRRVQMLALSRLWQSIPGAAAALVAVFQAYAWWFNARANAGALGIIRFFNDAGWSPPLGWWPWIALAGVGTVALLAFAAVGALTPQRVSAS
jgi:hypothetical protein